MTTPTSNPRPTGVADPYPGSAPAPGAAGAPSGEANGRANGANGTHGTPGTAVADHVSERPTAPALAPGQPPAPSPAPDPATAPAAAPHADAAAHRQHGPGHAGRHLPDPATSPRLQARGGKRKRLLLLVPVLLIALGVAAILGYRYWYESTYFVSTENAAITGDLVQVGSLNAGRIVATRVDVGRAVQKGQEIAVIAMPQEVGSMTQGAGPKMSVTGNADSLVSVYAPMSGIVAARTGNVGGTVTAGQPIYSLVDPTQVWIRANIEEASAWRLQVGQPVQIHADALNRDFTGHVDAVTPASAATFSLLPSNNASGNFTKVTQYVPVKIVVDDARGAVLPLGTSVEVRIQVRQPGSEFPLPWQP
ncbi:MAG: efflux RND transporter periplasmic adaptor subunit [Chloroflexota bacterium]